MSSYDALRTNHDWINASSFLKIHHLVSARAPLQLARHKGSTEFVRVGEMNEKSVSECLCRQRTLNLLNQKHPDFPPSSPPDVRRHPFLVWAGSFPPPDKPCCVFRRMVCLSAHLTA